MAEHPAQADPDRRRRAVPGHAPARVTTRPRTTRPPTAQAALGVGAVLLGR